MTEAAPEAVTTDHKGRPLPDLMSDRELIIELVTHMRVLADTVEELSATPMMKAMSGGGNPFMAMLRG